MLFRFLAVASVCALAGAGDPSAFTKELLDELNKLKDVVINPAMQAAIPNPVEINLKESGGKKTCIIKLFGKCTCKAEAKYSVSLPEIKGLNGLKISSFNSLDANIDFVHGFAGSLGLTVTDVDLNVPDGKAHAEVGACGIKQHANGKASTKAKVSLKVTAGAKGTINTDKNCVDFEVDSVDVNIKTLKIHDTSIDISLGPIPGIDVGDLTDLVLDLVPQIEDAIKKAASDAISKSVPSAINGAIPCLAIPIDETANATVVV